VVLLWIVVAVSTVQRSITGKMFYAPCLGTDMKIKEAKMRKIPAKAGAEKTV